MDEFNRKGYFQHSWWRILLILLALFSFIMTCIFNGLAGSGPNGMICFSKIKYLIMNICLGIFIQRTANVSDQNPTEFTPAGKLIILENEILF